MYRTDFWTLWEKVRVGWSERLALKHTYYQVWNRLPVQVGCMRQVLRAGALGWPRGMGWGERWEGGSGWGRHVNPWLIDVNVWQKPLQYCKVISLQLINEKKKKKVAIRTSIFKYSFSSAKFILDIFLPMRCVKMKFFQSYLLSSFQLLVLAYSVVQNVCHCLIKLLFLTYTKSKMCSLSSNFQ